MKNIKGFTLIEILVVVSIIGVLSTLVVLNVLGAQAKGRDAKRMSDLGAVRSALVAYKEEKKIYPVFSPSLASDYEFSVWDAWDIYINGSEKGYNCWCQNITSYPGGDPDRNYLYNALVKTGGFLNDLPVDPKNKEDMVQTSPDFLATGPSDDQGYVYKYEDNGKTAWLGTNLEASSVYDNSSGDLQLGNKAVKLP